MNTPTNSILNRETANSGLLSQLVYENESLKIEVEALREKLQSTGLLKLEDLRCENEGLKGEVAKLRVQLAEKTNQFEQYITSSDRFANIDQSLHELLTQIQTQRAELAEMRDSTREKDARIAELQSALAQSEAAVSEATAHASSASAAAAESSAQAAEHARLQAELTQANAELDTLRRASEQEATELQRRLTEAQEALLAMKEDAAAKSHVRGARMTSQEQEVSECREREAATQRQLVAVQAKMELLRTECSQLREENAGLTRSAQSLQQQLQQLQQRTQGVDLHSPEVKSHVDKAVQRATEGVERRLREQVEHNASLLSRMALIQQESEAMMKTKGMSTHEVSVMKERVDMRSRRNDARTTMQRRVAELLSNDVLSKEDIELLLQEMLDYQEETEQESRTMLLVKELEAEENERTLRRELKRVKDENASLMKQLQHFAVEGFQRERSNSTPAVVTGGGGINGNEPAPSTVDAAVDAAFAAREGYLGRHRHSVTGVTVGSDEPMAPGHAPAATPASNAWGSGAPSMPSPASASSMPPAAASVASMPAMSAPPLPPPQQSQWPAMPQYHAPPLATSPYMQHTQQQQQVTPPHPGAYSPRQIPQQQYGGDLWSNPPSQHHMAAQQRTGAATTTPPPPATMAAGYTDPHVRFAANPTYATDGAGSSPPASASANTAGGMYGARLHSSGNGGGAGGSSPAVTLDPNRNVMVQCPACTFEQRYGNRKCEICEATLQLR